MGTSQRRCFRRGEKRWHAWYSEIQLMVSKITSLPDEHDSGVAIYQNDRGEEVVVTEVKRSADPSRWNDAVYLGVVIGDPVRLEGLEEIRRILDVYVGDA